MSLSEEQRVCQLLMHEELGDWRPTQFLLHLRTLAGPSMPSNFLCTLWMNRLPRNIQSIITPFGLFDLPHISFGLRNAVQTFQWFIDEVLRDLDFCYAYIDDVLVACTSEEHKQHLRTLFQRFREYGALLNPGKRVFGAAEVTFLSYTVSAEGTWPLEEKVAAINRYQRPVLVKDLRHFFGMLNFYQRFIP